MKGSWPDLLVVSAKCFNVQQAHSQRTEAKVQQQADRCQGPGGETLVPLQGAGPGGGGESDMTAETEPTTESFPSLTPKMQHFYNTV